MSESNPLYGIFKSLGNIEEGIKNIKDDITSINNRFDSYQERSNCVFNDFFAIKNEHGDCRKDVSENCKTILEIQQALRERTAVENHVRLSNKQRLAVAGMVITWLITIVIELHKYF